MAGSWAVPTRVLPASSLLSKVHPLTPELCMVQATGKDGSVAFEPSVCVCTAWIYECDCVGTYVTFWVHTVVLCVTEFVHIGLLSDCTCVYVCVHIHELKFPAHVCLCLYLCICVYVEKTCDHKFGGSMFLLEHMLVYRERDLLWVYM